MTDKTKTVPAQRQLDEDLNSQASARAVTNTTGELVNDVRDTAPKPGPCPAWCVDEPGHDYDSITVEGDSYTRFHSGREYVFDRDDYNEDQPNGIQKRGHGSVMIAAIEDNDGTTVTYGEPVVSVWGAEDLNVQEASRLITALSEAHDELSMITHEATEGIDEYIHGVMQRADEAFGEITTSTELEAIFVHLFQELSGLKPGLRRHFIAAGIEAALEEVTAEGVLS